MIKFLNGETVAGYRYGKGTIATFDAATEAALVAAGDAEDYMVVAKPVEVLGSSAVVASCASTAVDEVLASFTIAAGVIGVNSILQFEPLWTFASSANNKICKVKVAGTTIYTSGNRTTSVKEAPLIVLANRNSLASQIQPYDYTYVQAGAGAPATYTINFAVAVTVEITGQRAAVENLKLEYYRVLHFVGD